MDQQQQQAPSPPIQSEKLKTRKWVAQEDEILTDIVRTYGDKDWKAIAAMFCERSPTQRQSVQCLQRWRKVLQPGLKKGKWSKEEDLTLIRLVNDFEEKGISPIRWPKISQLIPGRTSKQCRERWTCNLNPSICRDAFTEEEDQLILGFQSRFGNRWSLISQHLPGRTENAIKTRFGHLQKQHITASTEAVAAAMAAPEPPPTSTLVSSSSTTTTPSPRLVAATPSPRLMSTAPPLAAAAAATPISPRMTHLFPPAAGPFSEALVGMLGEHSSPEQEILESQQPPAASQSLFFLHEQAFGSPSQATLASNDNGFNHHLQNIQQQQQQHPLPATTNGTEYKTDVLHIPTPVSDLDRFFEKMV